MSLSDDEFSLCSSDCVIGAPGGAGVAVPGVAGGPDRAMKSRIVSASAVMASVICSFVAMTAKVHSDKNGCDKLELNLKTRVMFFTL